MLVDAVAQGYPERVLPISRCQNERCYLVLSLAVRWINFWYHGLVRGYSLWRQVGQWHTYSHLSSVDLQMPARPTPPCYAFML